MVLRITPIFLNPWRLSLLESAVWRGPGGMISDAVCIELAAIGKMKSQFVRCRLARQYLDADACE